MERATFIKLSGLTAIGFLTSGIIFSAELNRKNYRSIKISLPNLHARHGFFNLQNVKKGELHIQRDLFNKNGLQTISNNRMTSLKISHKNEDFYGILNLQGFKTNSKQISSIKLLANNRTTINLDSQSLLFSEYDSIAINGIDFESDIAYLQNKSGKVTISSKIDQSIFVYKRYY